MCHKLKMRALGKGKSGHAERYDVDPEHRVNMQRKWLCQDIFFNEGT